MTNDSTRVAGMAGTLAGAALLATAVSWPDWLATLPGPASERPGLTRGLFTIAGLLMMATWGQAWLMTARTSRTTATAANLIEELLYLATASFVLWAILAAAYARTGRGDGQDAFVSAGAVILAWGIWRTRRLLAGKLRTRRPRPDTIDD